MRARMRAAKRARDDEDVVVVVVRIFGAGCEHVFVNKIKQVVRSEFALPASRAENISRETV